MQNYPAEVTWWVNELQQDDNFEINSFPFVVFGVILLLTSSLFFNGGSVDSMFNSEQNAPKIIMCTIISAATAGLSSAFLKPLINGTYTRTRRYDVLALCNGVLAGLVSITGVCDHCEPWCAFFIGLIGSLQYSLACKLWKKLGVDDPIEASQVHGACGIWGLIAVGIFDNEKGLIFHDADDNFIFMGVQLCGLISILAWTVALTLPYFLIMKKLKLLRVPLINEIVGLDVAEMGSTAHIDYLIGQSIYRAH